MSTATMDDLTFLEELGGEYGTDSATLKAVVAEGRVCHISDRVNPYRLLDVCPLLYHAFEYGSQSRLQASIEAPSKASVISLLRHCYTGSYLPPYSEYTPPFLLLHAEVYKMAEDYDIPELQLLAHGNFSVQVDCACSLPTPPKDLLETIRFVYDYFASPQARQQQGLVHTLLNYCISMFQYHNLNESVEFLEVARQIPDFRQDLCRTNMERNFQDDCALEIVCLALGGVQPQQGIRPTILASRDLPQEMLIDRPASPIRATAFELTHRPIDTPAAETEQYWNITEETVMRVDSIASSISTLVYRPKQPDLNTGFETESSSEDEGFSIVHHPRPTTIAVPYEPMSSPEIIPSRPINILALTGSDYSDDEDWDML